MRKIKTAPSTPTEIEVNEISSTKAQVIAYPFESGYAITLAHPLRRLLLGSSIGYAPISLKIEGAAHEFDSIRGMHEDIAVFIINFKSIRFIIKDELDRATSSYSFKGPLTVTAGDLVNDQVDVVDKDIVLATLNEDAELNFSVEFAKGIGYVPSEDLRDEVDSDAIVLDAFFTPVRKANYTIENVLVEDNPDYEKIIFDIETDGQIKPVDALKNALQTMQSQLSIFSGVFNIDFGELKSVESGGDKGLLKTLMLPIDSLGLGARSFNSLDREGIKFLGELVLMSEKELKSIKNLGQRSVSEIKEMLAEYGFDDNFELDEETKSSLISKIEQHKE